LCSAVAPGRCRCRCRRGGQRRRRGTGRRCWRRRERRRRRPQPSPVADPWDRWDGGAGGRGLGGGGWLLSGGMVRGGGGQECPGAPVGGAEERGRGQSQAASGRGGGAFRRGALFGPEKLSKNIGWGRGLAGVTPGGLWGPAAGEPGGRGRDQGTAGQPPGGWGEGHPWGGRRAVTFGDALGSPRIEYHTRGSSFPPSGERLTDGIGAGLTLGYVGLEEEPGVRDKEGPAIKRTPLS